MPIERRLHRRMEKHLTIQFCVTERPPKKWDMSVVENISAGGIKFRAPHDMVINHKIIELQVQIPELAPLLLELDAEILEVKPRPTTKFSDVRAKFVNLSDENKRRLSIIERIVEAQEIKNAKKENLKKF